MTAEASLRAVRFLVVDDNQTIRALVRTICESFGAKQIIESADGVAGWDNYRAFAPDIVITDLNMPNMSGVDLIKKIRNVDESPNPFVPVILLTGYATPESVRAARDAGVSEIMVKPFTARTLLDRLAIIIDQPRPFVRTKVYFGPDRRRRAAPGFQGPERRSEGVQGVAS